MSRATFSTTMGFISISVGTALLGLSFSLEGVSWPLLAAGALLVTIGVVSIFLALRYFEAEHAEEESRRKKYQSMLESHHAELLRILNDIERNTNRQPKE